MSAPAATVGDVPTALLRVDSGHRDVVMAFSRRCADLPGEGNVSLVVGGGDPLGARRAILAAVGARLDGAVFMEQVHDARVAVVGSADRGRGAQDRGGAVPGVDALVTHDADVALVVQVADCVPLLLAAADGGVAAVHAGRRGVDAGIVGAAVAALSDDPDLVEAVVGPAIGGCCYEVSEHMAQATARRWPAARATTRWGTPAVDLPAAVRAQLAHAGVQRIRAVGSCTLCGRGPWFSHRREPGRGRQAGVVWRRSSR